MRKLSKTDLYGSPARLKRSKNLATMMDLMQFGNVAKFLESSNIPIHGDLILISTIHTRRAMDDLLLKYAEAEASEYCFKLKS